MRASRVTPCVVVLYKLSQESGCLLGCPVRSSSSPTEYNEHRRAHLVVHLVDRLAGHLAPFLLVLGERLPKRRGEEAAEGGAVGASALGDDLSESLVREGGIVEARLSLRRHERQSPERQAGGKPQRVQGFLSNQRFGGELLSNARDAIMKLINWMRSKHEIGARI